MSAELLPTREELIDLCERGVVEFDRWRNRDSAEAQIQLGKCRALLRAGCTFGVLTSGQYCVSDADTWWVEIEWPGFGTFDWGGDHEKETFYVPTAARLERRAGSDWY